MKIQHQNTSRWIAIAGLAGLVAGAGCSTQTVTVGSSGRAAPPIRQEASVKDLPAIPAEEVVKPLEVAKVQPAERKAEPPKRDLLDVYFAFDKWSLSPEGKKNLAQNVEALKQNPEAKLLIEGHCDERGSREYNLVLGEKRAHETRRYLLALGITNPVSVTSFGKERPVCTQQDESCYWKNRRAHLVAQDGK